MLTKDYYSVNPKPFFYMTFYETVEDNNGKERKPHGRMSYTIHVGGGGFIDLSVMVPQP